MNWTCCECENKYDNSTGDVDERLCNDCLDGVLDNFAEMEKNMAEILVEENIQMRSKIFSILKRCTLSDLRDVFDALVEVGYKEKS